MTKYKYIINGKLIEADRGIEAVEKYNQNYALTSKLKTVEPNK